MPERIQSEYRRARLAASIGTYSMYLISLFGLLILIAYCFQLPNIAVLMPNSVGKIIINAAALVFTCISTVLLAEFFRNFSKGSSPFGKWQTVRLITAGILFTLRLAIDWTAPIDIEPALNVIGQFVQVTSQPGPDLKVVVMVVFLVCLAMVVRYGDALKEDSDAFV